MFYRESSSQIERAGGLECGLARAAQRRSMAGGYSALRQPTSGDGGVELRHDVLRRHDAFARHVPAALRGGLVLEVDGDDTRPARDSRVRMTLMVLP